MRASGLKKIEKLQAQLGADAGLRAPGALEGLEEEELEALREAGIITDPSSNKKGKKRSARHIVFAEDEAEGDCLHKGLLPVLISNNQRDKLLLS